jgi:hypothetical protein
MNFCVESMGKLVVNHWFDVGKRDQKPSTFRALRGWSWVSADDSSSLGSSYVDRLADGLEVLVGVIGGGRVSIWGWESVSTGIDELDDT